MTEKEVEIVLNQANDALKIAASKINDLEKRLAFYANPSSWARNSFRLATSLPEDTGDLAGFDSNEKCQYLIGGKLAREYFKQS